MFSFMKNMVMSAVMFGLVFGQTPIIRVKQIGEWKTPEYWWKAQETVDLQDFLADDISQPAYLNNNFDSWRDDILEMEVTIDDNGADLTAFRFDIAFDNDLITWVEDDGETTAETTKQKPEAVTPKDISYTFKIFTNFVVGIITYISKGKSSKCSTEASESITTCIERKDTTSFIPAICCVWS